MRTVSQQTDPRCGDTRRLIPKILTSLDLTHAHLRSAGMSQSPIHEEPELIRRMRPDDDLGWVLALIRAAFAYMDGVIDPPSSMHRLIPADLAHSAAVGEVWVIERGGRPIACMVLTDKADALYLGKLAVEESHRGKGLARRMVDLAAARARERGKPYVELQTRIELTGNQRTFEALGFIEAGRTRHAGYNRDTSITYRKAV